jgi:hypothetical protein
VRKLVLVPAAVLVLLPAIAGEAGRGAGEASVRIEAPPADVGSVGPRGGPSRARAATAVDPGKACGRARARLVRFRVSIDRGLDITPRRFIAGVYSVLCDERSWIAGGEVRFAYAADGRLLVALRTPAATERRCRLLTGRSVREYYSCAGPNEAVLNADRWFHGSGSWPGSVAQYRRLLVNHEVGHTLGRGHRGCPQAGAPAPVMMQQSKGLHGCRANPWPLRYELR